MQKYIVWFPTIALMMIYISSVECNHKKQNTNKTDHLANVHLKHHHRAHKGKSVKRDLHSHFSQNGPIKLSKRVFSVNEQPGFHVNIPITYGNSKKEKRQITSDNSSIIESQENDTLDEISRVLGHQVSLEANMNLNETTEDSRNKSQPLLEEGISILSKIIDNIIDKKEQKTTQEFLTLDESKLKYALSRIFEAGQENKFLNESKSNGPVSFESVGLHLQPVIAANTTFNESENNASASVEVQSIIQSIIALNKYKNNVSDSDESRSLDVVPVPKENKSITNEPAFIETDSLAVQPIPQANRNLNDYNSNMTALVEQSSLGIQLLPQADTPLNDSESNQSLLVESRSLDVNPVSQESTDHKDFTYSDSPPVEIPTFEVQPASKVIATFSEPSRNESLFFESNSLVLQPLSQEDTAINEPKNNVSIA